MPQNVMVNETFDKFHNKLQELLDINVPIRKRVLKEKKFRREPWVTNGLSMSISKSKRLYKKSITYGAGESAILKYKMYRNCLNKVKHMAKTDYYRKLSTSLRHNTKKLWEIVNHTLGKEVNKTCAVDKLKIGNITYNNPGDVSNELAAYFASVGPNYAKDISAPKKEISDYLK